MEKRLVKELEEILLALSDVEKAKFLSRYFKMGVGQYGEGDIMMGINMKEITAVGKEYYKKMSMRDFAEIMKSEYHDMRRLGLGMLVIKYNKSKSEEDKKEILKAYLDALKGINNWDLVDCSAPHVIGAYTYEKDDVELLRELGAGDRWARRVAVVATLYWIKKGSWEIAKELIENNLTYDFDLMHKANGWMLREIGKKDEGAMLDFVYKHYDKMPRTTLRYAIERVEKSLYKEILNLNKKK